MREKRERERFIDNQEERERALDLK